MFDYNNIKQDEVFIGDIYLVTEVDKNLYYINKHLKKEDYIDTCEYKLYKKDAVVLKLNEKNYVDIDSIHNKNDYLYIIYCMSIGLIDNIVLNEGVKTPYVGHLFLKNVKKYDIKDNNLHILELKLLKNKDNTY